MASQWQARWTPEMVSRALGKGGELLCISVGYGLSQPKPFGKVQMGRTEMHQIHRPGDAQRLALMALYMTDGRSPAEAFAEAWPAADLAPAPAEEGA